VVVAIIGSVAVWVSDSNPRTPKAWVKVLFDNAEPIAIAAAAAVFLLESPDRRKAEQYEAWQVINSAMGQTGSGGRIQALEDLNKDGVDLAGVAVPRADLSGIDLSYGNLIRTNFKKAKLNSANPQGAYLVYANLQEAELLCADLHGANLHGADLHGLTCMTPIWKGLSCGLLTSKRLNCCVPTSAGPTSKGPTSKRLTSMGLAWGVPTSAEQRT